tara:strand:+ start:104 stop:1546 length:1443 start_codon:yes stop_codon:yes gene_type:complete
MTKNLIRRVPISNMAYELYDWQKAHASKLAFALGAHKVALDASDMGTGKTVIACKVAKWANLLPVVICPKSVIPNWRETISKELGYGSEAECSELVYNYEKLTRIEGHHLKILERMVVRGRPSFKWRLDPKKVILIFDEVHRCKGSNSLNSKLLYKAKEQGFRILMLSATAFATPLDMKSIGYALGLHGYRDYWTWCLSHGCKKSHFGGLRYTESSGANEKIHDQVFTDMKLGSRISIRDLPEGSFPDNIPIAQSYAIDDGYKFDFISSEIGRGLSEDSSNPLVELLRARQEAELMKVPILSELAHDAYSQGKSPVIFVNFRETMDAVVKLLRDWGVEENILTIHGDQDSEERQLSIDNFNGFRNQIMVAMIQAGGVGLSLHDVKGDSPRVSIISPGFSAIELRQAMGRIHRAGGKSTAVQYVVFADGTVEDHVRRRVQQKLNNLDILNDGDLQEPFLNYYEKYTKPIEGMDLPDYVQES